MKKFIYAALMLTALSTPASAKEILFGKNDARFLVNSCREVVEIFKRRDETSLLAAQRTSLAEGMRAGFCIGVLQQYSKSSGYCRYNRRNWFEMAKNIATLSIPESDLDYLSADRLLKEVYCDR